MSTKIAILSLVGSVLLTLSTGCGGADVPEPTQDDEAPVTQTIVTRDAGGKLSTTVKQITRAQQRAEFEARARSSGGDGSAAGPVGMLAQSLYVDTGCGDATIWLFNEPGLGGNQLCLNGGAVDLGSLDDFGWGGAVRSYWAGSMPGYFRFTPGLGYEDFGTWQRMDVAGVNAQNAHAMGFGMRPYGCHIYEGSCTGIFPGCSVASGEGYSFPVCALPFTKAFLTVCEGVLGPAGPHPCLF